MNDATASNRPRGGSVAAGTYAHAMPSRRLSPDTKLEINLIGTAGRLLREGVAWDDAVSQLREIADGRGDLLARAAGNHLGGYLASPGMHHPTELRAALWLLEAGAEPSLVAASVDRVRANASGSAYSDPGSQAAHQ